MKVQLIYADAPRRVHEVDMTVGEASSVETVVAQSGWRTRFPEIQAQTVRFSVWGRTVDLDTALRDGDRLEICRALRVDPKVARRERFVGQGARGTGLFAQRRPGSKAGY